MKKILMIEGAGMASAEVSRNTIGNCRCRTAFHLDDGRAVYLEFHGWDYKNGVFYQGGVFKPAWRYSGWVEFLHTIGQGAPVEFDKQNLKFFKYDHDSVLKMINEIGASFDDFVVINDGSYRVHGREYGTYNFGEVIEE